MFSKGGLQGPLGFCSSYRVFAQWWQCLGMPSTLPKTSLTLSLLEQSTKSERGCTSAGALLCCPSQEGPVSPAPAKWQQTRNGQCHITAEEQPTLEQPEVQQPEVQRPALMVETPMFDWSANVKVEGVTL